MYREGPPPAWNAAPSVGTPGAGRGRDWEGSYPRQGVCNKSVCCALSHGWQTRSCSWRREGRCSFGDRCKFMHDGVVTTEPKIVGESPQGIVPMEAASLRWRDSKEGPKDFYKTKLCEKFTTLGRCPYEERCTYAHGYDDLRPYSRQPVGIDAPFLPDASEKDPAGISEAPSSTSEKLRGREPQTEGYSSHTTVSFQSDATQQMASPAKAVAPITYLDKVKGICSCLGIGSPSIKPEAIQAALADVRSKAALKGNVYADDVGSYI